MHGYAQSMWGRDFPVPWLLVGLAVAASSVLWSTWAGGLEPVEMCAERAPDSTQGWDRLHAEAGRWPPGTTCVYDFGSSRPPVEIDMPASGWDWAGLALVSLALALVAVVLFLLARHVAHMTWRRLNST